MIDMITKRYLYNKHQYYVIDFVYGKEKKIGRRACSLNTKRQSSASNGFSDYSEYPLRHGRGDYR